MNQLHPFVVHFPLALFMTASFFGLIGLFYRRGLFKEFILWQNILGLLFVGFAIYTGLVDAEILNYSPDTEELIDVHMKNGFIIAGIFGSLTLWLAIRRKSMSAPEYGSMVVFLLIGCVAVIYQAHIGNKLVFQKGLGVEISKDKINFPIKAKMNRPEKKVEFYK